MKVRKILLIFKKALFPALMTTISFMVFIMIYWFLTVNLIEPLYFEGLIFAVPFICFGIVTLYTNSGKIKIVTSTVITSILIFVLSIAMCFSFVFIVIKVATTVTIDVGKYERVLKLTGYPDYPITKYFPSKISRNAKNIIFKYNPRFMQGSENFDLKFETDSESIKNYTDQFSHIAKWTGKPSDGEAQINGIFSGAFSALGYTYLPEDFMIYLIDSKPYKPCDWNHGELSLVAVSKQRKEIIFLAEDW